MMRWLRWWILLDLNCLTNLHKGKLSFFSYPGNLIVYVSENEIQGWGRVRARDSRFKFQQRHLFRLKRIDNVYKFIAVIRLKASFQFFTDENLKKGLKKICGNQFWYWYFSLKSVWICHKDWDICRFEKGTDAISIHSFQELKHIFSQPKHCKLTI